jgi:hypothetical protein
MRLLLAAWLDLGTTGGLSRVDDGTISNSARSRQCAIQSLNRLGSSVSIN